MMIDYRSRTTPTTSLSHQSTNSTARSILSQVANSTASKMPQDTSSPSFTSASNSHQGPDATSKSSGSHASNYTPTASSIRSVVSGTASPLPAVSGRSFLIAFQGPASPPLDAAGIARRQNDAPYYITLAGEVANCCLDSAKFTLTTEGELYADGTNVYSTSTDVTSSRFVPITPPGNIPASWVEVSDTLQWRNNLFLNALAPLCAEEGIIYVFFLEDMPDGCFPIILEILECKYRYSTM